MNISQFTYRDFVVYFTTGIVLILCIYVIFFVDLNKEISFYFNQFHFVDQFIILITISGIALVYITGHFINIIDYWIGELYRMLYRYNEKCNCKFLFLIRKIFETIFYKNRIIYRVLKDKKNKENLPYKDHEEFWIICAELQITKSYGNCEYWYSLNDLFKGLYLVFLLSFIIAIWTCQVYISSIFLILSVLSFLNSIRFAKYFADTVNRNVNAKNKLFKKELKNDQKR